MALNPREERERAKQMVERFVRRFQPSYKLLAYHAALPLVLTPELLNFLRVQFLQGVVPWVGEVDLLLSDLCKQVGYELYAMDTGVRAYLLGEMKQELGEGRMQEVARLLISYVKYLHQNNPYISPKELQAQQWAAMVYVEPETVVREIAEEFRDLVDKAELARLSRITHDLEPQLRKYQGLMDYATLVSRVLNNGNQVQPQDLRTGYQVSPHIELHLPDNLLPHNFKSNNFKSNNFKPNNLTTQTPISKSPFSHRGSITNPANFFDREELLHQIFQILAEGGNISLVGESVTGKSSILHKICREGKERLRSMGGIERDFVYLNLQLVTTEEELYQAVCDVLGVEFSQGYQLARKLRNKYYVLCLDEFEKLSESTFTDRLQSQLRGLADGINTPLKLVIASRSPLEDLFPEIPTNTSPLYNILTQLTVEPFSLAITQAFFAHYLAGTGVEFSQQQINQLYAETRGKPGRLQEVGDKLYRQIISSNSSSVNTSPDLKIFQFEVVKVNRKGQITKRESHQANYFTEDLSDGVTLEMVYIPGGSFMMGAPETEEGSTDAERPLHQVNISPFFMGKYPIIQKQWRVVANLPQINQELDSNPSHFQEDYLPATKISWYDAMEFCARLSSHTGRQYRLPSEAEWEYACRARTTTPFYFGETITTDLVNYRGNFRYHQAPKGKYRRKTSLVTIFPPNSFGLYDMHGNVGEWCIDSWHKNYEGAPRNGSAWIDTSDSQLHIIRGGSWRESPNYCRSSCRRKFNLSSASDRMGLRLVLATQEI